MKTSGKGTRTKTEAGAPSPKQPPADSRPSSLAEPASGKVSSSEDHYRLIFEHSPIGIIHFNSAGVVTDCNTRFAEIFSVSRDRAIGFDMRASLINKQMSAAIDASLRGASGSFEGEYTSVLSDRRMILKAVFNPVASATGKITGGIGICEDVTYRTKIERDLREREKVLNAIIDAEPECVKTLAADGTLLMMNRSGLAMIQADSSDQVVGKSIYPLVAPEHRDAFRTLTEGAFAGRSGTLEFAAIGLKGRWIWLETHVVPLRNERNEILSLLAVTRDITERKRAEDALKKSEERLAQAQEIAHVGNWEWDTATNQVFWSDEVFRIYGYEPGEVHPDYELVLRAMHPDTMAAFLQGIDDALTRDQPFEMDYAFLTKDGKKKILHTIGRVLRDDNGRPQRMVGTLQDLTEQKRIEDALRESEGRFRTLFERAPDAEFLADIESGLIVDANPAASRLLMRTRREILGMHQAALHPPRLHAVSKDRFAKHIEETRGTGPTVPMESMVIRSDGQEIPVEISSQLVLVQGKPLLYGIFRDISRRKQAEAMVSNILETVDEAFIIIDRDYRIISANRAYAGQAHLPVEDIFGRHCYEISHQQQRPCFETGEECAVRRCFETGEPALSLHKHGDRDGNVIYVETKSYPVRDASGSVVSAIEVINNITEKYLLEEQLLRNQKLEAVGLLAGGIAHDFNNLLQGVFGSISLAKNLAVKDGAQYRHLEDAERAVQLSRSLTRQLLTFSKGGEPVIAIVSLPQMILDSAKFALSGSNVDFQFSKDDDLWTVQADEGQLSQVLQNIVLNAGDAMPEGGTVTIRARNMNDGKDGPPGLRKDRYVKITIEDSGAGIPQEHLSRIFDPYFTTKEKGTGLGLATSYSIIRKHGGLLEVHSELGKGSIFTIYIPASGEAAPASVSPAAGLVMGKGRVLFMDDEEIVRNVAGYMLQTLGYEAVFAENGEQAVARYADALRDNRPFDAVILDLTIRGGLGGMETFKKLHEIDPAVRSIVSSGYSDDPLTSKYKEIGFKALLSKPYEVESLSQVLNAVIGRGVPLQARKG